MIAVQRPFKRPPKPGKREHRLKGRIFSILRVY